MLSLRVAPFTGISLLQNLLTSSLSQQSPIIPTVLITLIGQNGRLLP